MKNFAYIARDLSGRRREGYRQGVDKGQVLAWLREQALTPVSVELMGAAGEKKARAAKGIGGGRRKRIKSSDLSALCWQLNTLLEGGVGITAALDTVAGDIDNSQLSKVLEQISERIKKGESLSESVSQFGGVFNNLARAMLMAGEQGGNLPMALKRLAEYYDRRDVMGKKVKGAMIYPSFVFVFIVLIVIFIMTFIVPRFRIMFDRFGGELPAFTRGFMGFYDAVSSNVHYIIGAVAVICGGVVMLSKTEGGHKFLSRVVIRLPMFGKILKQSFLSTYCRTMGTLVASGVSVLEVFDILSSMTNNDAMKSAIVKTKEHMVEGSNISLGMGASGLFPGMVVKMVHIGEESGSLAQVLERTADYYERKVDCSVTAMMNMLEPLMIVVVGAIVLVVVLALYMPIFARTT